MNPTLMLCLMICPLGVVGTVSLFHFGLWIPALLIFLLTCAPLGIASWQIIRFTLTDTDRLQNEQFVQNMLQIRQTLGVKEQGELREIVLSGELTPNPSLEDRSGE